MLNIICYIIAGFIAIVVSAASFIWIRSVHKEELELELKLKRFKDRNEEH